ncbi:MAG TPA: TolC family protein, partial [Pyrinomonadaceae bacterium]|nr:TolC family protein [Pyrinomonadaceae bacterium]
MVNRIGIALSACLIIVIALQSVSAQRKSKKKPEPAAPAAVAELTKLREEFVRLTNETKAGLEKLIAIYEADVPKAEKKLAESKKLFEEGLVSRVEVEENERALAAAREKVAATRKQMTDA